LASPGFTDRKQGWARMERECGLRRLDDKSSLFVVPLKGPVVFESRQTGSMLLPVGLPRLVRQGDRIVSGQLRGPAQN